MKGMEIAATIPQAESWKELEFQGRQGRRHLVIRSGILVVFAARHLDRFSRK